MRGAALLCGGVTSSLYHMFPPQLLHLTFHLLPSPSISPQPPFTLSEPPPLPSANTPPSPLKPLHSSFIYCFLRQTLTLHHRHADGKTQEKLRGNVGRVHTAGTTPPLLSITFMDVAVSLCPDSGGNPPQDCAETSVNQPVNGSPVGGLHQRQTTIKGCEAAS